jgi:hypothetical protein
MRSTGVNELVQLVELLVSVPRKVVVEYCKRCPEHEDPRSKRDHLITHIRLGELSLQFLNEATSGLPFGPIRKKFDIERMPKRVKRWFKDAVIKAGENILTTP